MTRVESTEMSRCLSMMSANYWCMEIGKTANIANFSFKIHPKFKKNQL